MILRHLVLRRPCIKYFFKNPNKFPCAAVCEQTKSINKVIVSNIANFSICNIPCEINQKSNFIIGSQCYEISKRFYSPKHRKSKLRKDDDLQPELKEVPLEEGDFSLSQTHFDRKIHDKDIGIKFTVGEDVITALNNVYGIDRGMALTMMRSRKFLLVADSTILQTVYFLAKSNISPEQIQRIPWLLLYDCDILQNKMDLLVGPHLFKNIEDGLGFCYFPKQKIYNTRNFFSLEAKDFPNHQNRLYYMASEMLEVPVAHLAEKIVKPHRVMSMDFKRILDIFNLLKSYGVSSDDILRDLWIFFHNINRSEERLRAITGAGCTRPRTWMCRCQDEVFEKTMKHYEDKKVILGSSMTVVEYLAEQLHCSTEEVEVFCASNTHLLRVRVPKLQRIMEMLLSEGITREAIRTSPRILQYSEKTLKSRIHRLKALGYQPMSCPTLFKTQSKFESFCNNLKDNKFRMEYSTQDTSINGVKDPYFKPTENKLF